MSAPSNANNPGGLVTTANNRHLWFSLRDQIHPFAQVLSIDGHLFNTMDNNAKQYIAMKFMNHVQENVIYVHDGNGPNRIYLGAPRHFVTGGGMVIDPNGRDLYWIRRGQSNVVTATMMAPPQPKNVKIPRPPNAYILYRKERHQLVKRANPGITNNEISQLLGKAWNMETPAIRAKYKQMSDEIKEALMKKHPDYVYRPRRPGERRRRRRQEDGEDDDA
ncbi:hypothetical protein L249_8210 [Ophiocordyceps polyrhachis-furcata BCC 54312]|uniref:HMG box domain-containing protein n=1 Tax=Ophiocordyceps polyrhachis-furcata BCC 54312 TaxID=1330021 RepID=A0A367LH32_9HYPO|nr:hypothetical protein L249_8210 [Ophiocordyceps polyrhachis-furcata BCC 54312]